MRRQEVIEMLHEAEAELRRTFGVASLRLFGSLARDEAAASSDVDLLVSFTEPPSFRRFMQLKIFLEERLGARVDLVTETGLKAWARPYVEHDAIRVA